MFDTSINVCQSENDADTLITKVSLDIAQEGKECAVVADDTDVLVLLVHYFKPTMAAIYFVSEASKRSKDGMKIYDIRSMLLKLEKNTNATYYLHMRGPIVTQHLQFMDTVMVLF